MQPPPVGAPKAAIEDYLAHLRLDVRKTKQRVRSAELEGDDVEARRLELLAREKKATYRDERERLTKRNEDLVVAGGTLIGVGTLALTSSAIMGAVALGASLDFDDGTDASGPATASLLSLALGQGALGAGIPMVVIGVRRVPRSPDDVPPSTTSTERLDTARGPTPGITAAWSFW